MIRIYLISITLAVYPRVMRNIVGISGYANSGKDTVANFLRDDLGFQSLALADPLKRICRDVFDFTDEQLWGPSGNRNAPDTRYPRPHTWLNPDAGFEATCACCGQTTTYRSIEDDVRVENTEDLEPCYLTPRFALQLLGTEWGRTCSPDTWVNLAIRTAKTVLSNFNAKYDQRRGLTFNFGESDWAQAELREKQMPSGIAIPDVRFGNEIRGIREAGGILLRVKRPRAGLGAGAASHASEAEMASIPDRAFDAVLENDGTLDQLQELARTTVMRLCRAPVDTL